MQRKNVQTSRFVPMITLQQKNDRTKKINDNTEIKVNIRFN